LDDTELFSCSVQLSVVDASELEGGTVGNGLDDARRHEGEWNEPADVYVPDLHIDTIRVKARDFH
jgi:hypothetical protein